MKSKRRLILILLLIAALVLLATLRNCGIIKFDPDPHHATNGPE